MLFVTGNFLLSLFNFFLIVYINPPLKPFVTSALSQNLHGLLHTIITVPIIIHTISLSKIGTSLSFSEISNIGPLLLVTHPQTFKSFNKNYRMLTKFRSGHTMDNITLPSTATQKLNIFNYNSCNL